MSTLRTYASRNLILSDAQDSSQFEPACRLREPMFIGYSPRMSSTVPASDTATQHDKVNLQPGVRVGVSDCGGGTRFLSSTLNTPLVRTLQTPCISHYNLTVPNGHCSFTRRTRWGPFSRCLRNSSTTSSTTSSTYPVAPSTLKRYQGCLQRGVHGPNTTYSRNAPLILASWKKSIPKSPSPLVPVLHKNESPSFFPTRTAFALMGEIFIRDGDDTERT